MKNLRSVTGGLAAGAFALLLAGCSWSYQPPMRGNPSTSGFNVGRLNAKVTQNPTTFPQALTSDYASFATSLYREQRDYADADYFARKGSVAADGVAVPPENNSNWLIPLEVPRQYRTQLAEGRQRLVAALDNGGRDRLPAIAARAQVSYDCWVERMEDDWREAADGPCHKQFLAALARLEGRPAQQQQPAQPAAVPAPMREYRIYFEFDKSAILPEAQQILQQVAAQTKQDPNLHVELIGKADRAGSDAYNLKLSERRAEAVRRALVQAGVPADRITARWVGEREPPVPTPQGVREPRNRVVDIDLH